MKSAMAFLLAGFWAATAYAQDLEPSGDGAAPAAEIPVEAANASGDEGAAPAAAADGPASAVEETDDVASGYQLVQLDQIRFLIAEDPKTSQERDRSLLIVNSLGVIEFPVSQGYPDSIPLFVRGKTIDQVREEIKARLEAEYYQKATVTIQLLTQQQRPGTALFHGAVKGTVTINPGEQKTLKEAILELGYNEYANLKRVRIQRVDPETEEPATIDVNVKEILDDNKVENDVILLDGDVVHVPERSFVF